MTSDVVIRPVAATEHARVAALTLAAYRDLGFELGPYRASLADIAGRSRAADVLVAERDGQLLGAVTYVADRDNPYAEFRDDDAAGIRMLAVDPRAQGHGVGRRLVDACITRAAADRRRRVVLHTTTEMAAARELYVRLGFRRAPHRDWRPQPHVSLLGYELLVAGIAAGAA